jgi:hypothetical protein
MKHMAVLSGVIAAALCMAACRPTAAPVSSESPTTVSSAPTLTPNPSFEALVAEGIRVREMFGLRADEAWVREVTADPDHRMGLEIPLTLAEQAELDARAAGVERLGAVLHEYGEDHPEEFVGMSINNEEGSFVVLFTGHLEEHAAAIAKLIRPGEPVEIRLAPTSEEDLLALMDRIDSDGNALRTVGVFTLVISTDEEAGRVVVEVSTERGDAQPLLAARYGPLVEVRILDPTGAYLKPRGEIRGQVVDGDGDGVQANVGSEPLFAKDLPMDSIGPPETEPDGTFVLDHMLPGRWRITAIGGFDDVSVEVDVPPGGVATVELVVDP